MSDHIRIRLEHVTKYYSMRPVHSAGIKHLLLHLPAHLKAARRSRLCALDDLSLAVRSGECLGVIGRNGAGKSTALGLMAGVLRPTSGTIEIDGHVCPLLELGAGFHHELTGEENITLNGVLLGLTRREVAERKADIIAFAELEDFMEQPLRTYSSGMMARLGFSVAVHLNPEILLIDEVLAVGDEAFQRKCLRRMEQFRSSDTAMVYVGHNLDEVERICDRVALLDHGRLTALGPPGEVVPAYKALAGKAEGAAHA